jgi:aspartyl-tRNA(Asn)/glutamyl-tRNA(Gln) amidotransferase subunit A
MRERRVVRAALDRIFEHVDVIVAPTYGSVAFPIGVPFDKAYPGVRSGPLITACNLAGVPAVSVPSGFGLHGLPTGIMFVARSFAESDAIGLAAAFQAHTDWHRRRPAVALS